MQTKLIASAMLAALMGVMAGCAVNHKRGANVDAVIETYRQNKSTAETCYRQGLREDPSIAGKVLLTWKVDQTGKAIDAKVLRSELANATVETCLLDHLKGLKFPAQARFSPAMVEFELDFAKRANNSAVKP